MAVLEASRYSRATKIEVVDPSGRFSQPPYLDTPPRLLRVSYPDNQYIPVDASFQWAAAGLKLLGDARGWWALAMFSGVIDPFTEAAEGVVLTAPSLTTYQFILRAGEDE